jgi:hypothetical protein
MRAIRITMAWAVVILWSISASAQNTGSITGTVKDSSGGVLPGADVIVTNTQTGVEARTVSSSDGKFQFPSVVPGTYVTAAEMQGFKKNASKPFELHVGDRLSFDLGLEIGGASEEVTVTATAPMLRTADARSARSSTTPTSATCLSSIATPSRWSPWRATSRVR